MPKPTASGRRRVVVQYDTVKIDVILDGVTACWDRPWSCCRHHRAIWRISTILPTASPPPASWCCGRSRVACAAAPARCRGSPCTTCPRRGRGDRPTGERSGLRAGACVRPVGWAVPGGRPSGLGARGGPGRRGGAPAGPGVARGAGPLRRPDPPQADRLAALRLAFFAPGHDPRPWLRNWHPEAGGQRAASAATPKMDWWGAGSAPVLDLQAALDPWRPRDTEHDVRDDAGRRPGRSAGDPARQPRADPRTARGGGAGRIGLACAMTPSSRWPPGPASRPSR